MTVLRWGSQTTVNRTFGGSHNDSAVAALADGGWVVLWNDSTTTDIRGQRYGAAGDAVGSEFTANATTPGTQVEVAVTGLANGGFAVSYTHPFSGTDNDIYARLYDATGKATIAPSITTTGNFEDFSALAQLGSGAGFVAVFHDETLNSGDIRAWRFDAAGAKTGSVISINSTTAGNQDHPDVATLQNGGFVAVWDTDTNTVTARIFNSSGTAVTGELAVSNGAFAANGYATVKGLAGGGFA